MPASAAEKPRVAARSGWIAIAVIVTAANTAMNPARWYSPIGNAATRGSSDSSPTPSATEEIVRVRIWT
jgi:hypothetical protein